MGLFGKSKQADPKEQVRNLLSCVIKCLHFAKRKLLNRNKVGAEKLIASVLQVNDWCCKARKEGHVLADQHQERGGKGHKVIHQWSSKSTCQSAFIFPIASC